MRTKTTRLAVLCLLCASATNLQSASSWAADVSAPYRFFKQVERGEATGEEILGVTLDSAVYDAVGDDYADLRVVDGGTRSRVAAEVPYHFEKVTESRSRTVHGPRYNGRVVSLEARDDNSIEIKVDLALPPDAKTPPIDGIAFFTPLKNFERRVTVYGSSDGDQWQPLASEAMIYDYSRYMDVSNHEVPFARNNYRQFKAVIEDVTDQAASPLMELTRRFQGGDETGRTETTTVQRRPLRIDRIQFWSNVTTEHQKSDAKADYPIVDFQSKEDAKEKCTIITVRSRRQPLTSFTLQTESTNFSRRVVVQVPVERGIRTEWTEVGRATISKIGFRDFQREDLSIDFPQQRQHQYRLVIHNQDNPPVEITGVAAEGNVYRLVFLALAGEEYRVYYGAEEAERPSYDTASVLSALREGYQPVRADLGRETENTGFGPPSGLVLRRILGSGYFFGFVICLVVVVLAWGLYRAGRRIDQLPTDGE